MLGAAGAELTGQYYPSICPDRDWLTELGIDASDTPLWAKPFDAMRPAEQAVLKRMLCVIARPADDVPEAGVKPVFGDAALVLVVNDRATLSPPAENVSARLYETNSGRLLWAGRPLVRNRASVVPVEQPPCTRVPEPYLELSLAMASVLCD